METPPSSFNGAVTTLNGEPMGEASGLYVKVMTDEQMEVLRRQISVYATLCEQLVEMHKAFTAHNDSVAVMRLGNLYFDSMATSGGNKITARQRWTPTPVQLQILENIFDQGTGTPSKQKIKDITLELSQHGQISETNVYNWFQNRRARSKRKQTTLLDNTESEAEAEDEIPSEKRAKSEKRTSNENMSQSGDDPSFYNNELSSELGDYTVQDPKRTADQITYYENILPNPRIDDFMGKMEIPGSYNTFQSQGNYDYLD
uniref:WUS2 n=1 Tax=Hemerocallis middendorffii TaxID=213589 RepID=A0A9E7LUQ9_9ASPA|nr:WUSCHEL-related homeobox 8-like protein [Hemerocallis middendorffii]